jgi:hypothetical protein
MAEGEGKRNPRTGLKTGHFIRKGATGWEAVRATGRNREVGEFLFWGGCMSDMNVRPPKEAERSLDYGKVLKRKLQNRLRDFRLGSAGENYSASLERKPS